VAITNGKCDVMLFSDSGKAVRFDEDDVRPMGREARGVRGMSLEEGQRVISMLVADSENYAVLTACENGFGKRTVVSEYRTQNRGGKGLIDIQTEGRNGPVIEALAVTS
jgi:DNA gyrase subunit A